jgi:hypothetical protein
MLRISQRVNQLSELPGVLEEVRKQLQYHTESGFTAEEANGYAQQLDDLETILIPGWRERLKDAAYEVDVECVPVLGGFIKIKIQREGEEPVVVFTESYAHFNSEMCDGSCYQYVYQKVLCYEDGLASGRVPL